MSGVTRTRGSARADHSIDATPPAAPAPASQSLLGYMTSRLYAGPPPLRPECSTLLRLKLLNRLLSLPNIRWLLVS